MSVDFPINTFIHFASTTLTHIMDELFDGENSYFYYHISGMSSRQ